MDINMPIMDGIQASNILKDMIIANEVEPLSLVAVTGDYFGKDERDNFLNKTGFNELFTKPIVKKDFIDLLIRHNIIF